uniref:Uncharacterized protein n=1 Tax=Chrysemys picta bellii TaxID=8478 RepID=A0A8C3HDX9_CHRPI
MAAGTGPGVPDGGPEVPNRDRGAFECNICLEPAREAVIGLWAGRQDPRTWGTPPRPRGQRPEPESRGGLPPPYHDAGFHMAFGIGAFPFGVFTTVLRGDAVGGSPWAPPWLVSREKMPAPPPPMDVGGRRGGGSVGGVGVDATGSFRGGRHRGGGSGFLPPAVSLGGGSKVTGYIEPRPYPPNVPQWLWGIPCPPPH